MSNYRRRLILANQSEENLCFYGNSVQDGTPTPDAPIDIMSLENPTIKVTGENLLTYEPYEEEIIEVEGYTLRGIGDYTDRIYTKDNKVWYEQNIKTMDLADYTYSEFGSGLGMAYTKNNIDIPTSYYAEGLCSIYKVELPPTGVENIPDNAVVIGRNDKKVYIRDIANISTADDFNAWIQNKESELLYPLATPIVTEITGTLAEKILAIDKTKNISVTSSNGVSGNVEVIDE